MASAAARCLEALDAAGMTQALRTELDARDADLAAMLPLMDHIYSIEMDDWSYQRALRRFARCAIRSIRTSCSTPSTASALWS